MEYLPRRKDVKHEEELKRLKAENKRLKDKLQKMELYSKLTIQNTPVIERFSLKEKLIMGSIALALSTISFFAGMTTQYLRPQPQQSETRQRGEIIRVYDIDGIFGLTGGIWLSDGENEWSLLGGSAWEYPALSPDKNRVALVYYTSTSEYRGGIEIYPENGIYAVNVDSSNLRRLTFDTGHRVYDDTPFWIDNDTIGFIRYECNPDCIPVKYQIDIGENNIGSNLRLYEE